MVQTISDTNFDGIIAAGGPVIVDFWAPWCGPCRMLSPVVDELSEEYEGKVTFCKCNVDEVEDIPLKCGIRNIPVLLFYKDGQLVDRLVGANPKGTIEEKIKSIL